MFEDKSCIFLEIVTEKSKGDMKKTLNFRGFTNVISRGEISRILMPYQKQNSYINVSAAPSLFHKPLFNF